MSILSGPHIATICFVFLNLVFSFELFQDPLRASDKALTSSGQYMMKEEDATVYRRPYLVSGSAGFALNAITRGLGKDLKVVCSSIFLLWFC
jgi:hypothetical protein